MSKQEADALPPPECPLGYPRYQIDLILGHKAPRFWAWFAGQTGSICDGQFYNHELRVYVPNECAGHSHGPVVYASDLYKFVCFDGRITTDW
jgi:hypothetical protein